MATLNSIHSEQNQPNQLEKLRAFSQLYLEAKRWLTIDIILSISSALIGSIVIAFYPKLTIYCVVFASLVTLVSFLFINPHQKKLQVEAAKIQQLLDCELFGLDWEEFRNIGIGSPPDYERISDASDTHKNHSPDDSNLRDWYPIIVKEIPLPFARLVCQRTNCWWDGEQRRKYSNWIIILLSIFSVSILMIGLIKGLTLETFISSVFFPLLPILILGIRQYRENMQAAATLDTLKNKVREIWSKIECYKSNEFDQLKTESIELQSQIFKNRATSPLIFNWFYQLLREKQQDSMNKGAKELVEDIKKKLEQLEQENDDSSE